MIVHPVARVNRKESLGLFHDSRSLLHCVILADSSYVFIGDRTDGDGFRFLDLDSDWFLESAVEHVAGCFGFSFPCLDHIEILMDRFDPADNFKGGVGRVLFDRSRRDASLGSPFPHSVLDVPDRDSETGGDCADGDLAVLDAFAMRHDH